MAAMRGTCRPLRRCRTSHIRSKRSFDQRLFVLAIDAPTQIIYEQLRALRSSGIGCDRNRCSCYQNSMPKNTCSQYRITSNSSSKGNCPHECQSLQHVVPCRNIRNVTKRTHFSIEYQVPSVDDKLSDLQFPSKPTSQSGTPLVLSRNFMRLTLIDTGSRSFWINLASA